jgi:Fe2+ or Zn2+ uptake regulation protein
MSIDATCWAWQQKITPSQKLVLLALADRADEHFNCYPSIQRMVNDTGLNLEQIRQAIVRLDRLGSVRSFESPDSEKLCCRLMINNQDD